MIEHRRPDIILVNYKNKQCHIIDVAIPVDAGMTDKELEKIVRYTPTSYPLLHPLTINNPSPLSDHQSVATPVKIYTKVRILHTIHLT